MRERQKYASVRVSFDIETTNYWDMGVKKTIVYAYTLCVDGVVERYRHRYALFARLDELVAEHAGGPNENIVVWVHNLAYEFSFIRAYYEWVDIFAISERHKVARARTCSGVEFRCTYLLTGKGLGDVGKEVGVEKKVGDLDYNLMRHSETPLTDEEWGYIDNDVLILDELIRQRLERDTMSSIPMTKTGYVRRRIRKAVRGTEAQEDIANMILTLEDYTYAKQAFAGGYAHANPRFSGKLVHGVTPFDLSSAYPAVMVRERFPVTSFTNLDPERVPEYLGKAALLLDVTLYDVECNYDFAAISESKCLEISGQSVDNGRVFSADRLRVIVTDVELATLKRNYTSRAVINSAKVAAYGYLPRPIVETVLDLYGKKTTLKGVKGMEVEYASSKEDINSIYGDVASDPVKTEFVHIGEGILEESLPNIAESIDKHNRSRSRALFFPWGAWVTAYTRGTLLGAIMDLADEGVDVLYCDTDSTYSITHPAVFTVMERINSIYLTKNAAAAEAMGFDPELYLPKDPEGTAHPIGLFEHDNHGKEIEQFKTLGAKRYATVKDGVFAITVAGLNKTAGAEYIAENGSMDFFADGMEIPAEHSGRLVHTYIEDYISNIMVDHLGNAADVDQDGYVHLEPAPYKLTISDEYKDFMQLFNMDRL